MTRSNKFGTLRQVGDERINKNLHSQNMKLDQDNHQIDIVDVQLTVRSIFLLLLV